MTNNTQYETFLASKAIRVQSHGVDIERSRIHPILFPFQKDGLMWALRKGRAAIFWDTGLGKTFLQVEWARLISKNALIVAPLGVARQTIDEALKIDCLVRYARSQADVTENGIWITNYERIEDFDPGQFDAVVLDESSILKALDGKTRRKLTEMFSQTPYRLCCTATPAPNDQSEIGNHAEFLGICDMDQMLSMFFIHANKVHELRLGNVTARKKLGNAQGQEWRLKYHAKDAFFSWLASWGMFLRKPSNLGYDDDGFILPPITVKPTIVRVDYQPEGQLFFTGLSGIGDRARVRHSTEDARVKVLAEMVNDSPEQWIIWCGLNSESALLAKLLKDSVEIVGSDDPEDKAETIKKFKRGEVRVLVTKPKIAGFGMNFQNAHKMAFFGLNDSWEQYYQCIRREWRFGQAHPVDVHIIISELEQEIYQNIMRKERAADEMATELIRHISTYEKQELTMPVQHKSNAYHKDMVTGDTFTAMLGDSSERLGELEENSIDLSVYSPPFADLYTYSNSERDLGNSRDWEEFFQHYSFIVRELLRVTKPGRLTCVHTADIPAMAVKDGYIGMKDFPGAVVVAYEKQGWIFTGRAIVGKNPQAQAIRTKSKALLFVQVNKDSADSRPAIFDQVLLFKKPGDSAVPITPAKNGDLNNETWIDWASGIWLDVKETDTLQYSAARANDDEKHICPLQLGTIERCIKLWSNPGETVLTPFMGIGSEAYQAIKFNRRAIGIELKESYFRIAVKNLQAVEAERKNVMIFTTMAAVAE